MLLHRGKFIQRGGSFGGWLGSLFRAILPIGKSLLRNPSVASVLSSVKNSALKAGANVVQDVLHGENLGESFKKNAKRVKSDTIDAIGRQIGRGKKPVKQKRKRPTKSGQKLKMNSAAVSNGGCGAAKRQCRHVPDLFDE